MAKNRLYWGRGSERPAAHAQYPLPRGDSSLFFPLGILCSCNHKHGSHQNPERTQPTRPQASYFPKGSYREKVQCKRTYCFANLHCWFFLSTFSLSSSQIKLPDIGKGIFLASAIFNLETLLLKTSSLLRRLSLSTNKLHIFFFFARSHIQQPRLNILFMAILIVM